MWSRGRTCCSPPARFPRPWGMSTATMQTASRQRSAEPLKHMINSAVTSAESHPRFHGNLFQLHGSVEPTGSVTSRR